MEKELTNIDNFIKARALEIVDKLFVGFKPISVFDIEKNAPEEVNELQKLNDLAQAKFQRAFNDLNEAEKDEILNAMNSPLIAQPMIVPKPATYDATIPAHGKMPEQQTVLKGYTADDRRTEIIDRIKNGRKHGKNYADLARELSNIFGENYTADDIKELDRAYSEKSLSPSSGGR